jgi:ATP-dependent DNA helicase RecQ
MMTAAKNMLLEKFGFSEFRGGQETVVSALLDGRSVLAVFPTGGGKSLCYQLPAILLEGVTLVISPLIALMKDQVDALQRKGIAAARLDSSLTQDQVAAVYVQIANHSLQLLYVSPERMSNEGFRAQLKKMNIAMVAIDEAHCISEWGHNFRPDYLKLARLCRKLKVQRVLALTATATPAVAQQICQEFSIRKDDHVQLSFHRENLYLAVTSCSGNERKKILLDRLLEIDGAAVVYVTRQETAEEISTYLAKNGVSSQAYHAGLLAEVRAAAQDAFMKSEVRVIVATIAFGMGIDKSDIRAVIHYNLPKSIENYTQEIGRAGRDGKPARCELLASGDDLTVLQNFIYGDAPSAGALVRLLDRILRLGEEFDVSHYELASSCDIRILVIGTIFAYLELDGVIETTKPFYATFEVKTYRTLDQIVAGYDTRRQNFLRKIFGAATKGWIWYKFPIDQIALETGETREKIITALGYLEQMGEVVIKKTGVRQGYRVLKSDVRIRNIALELERRFQLREVADLKCLQSVVDYAESNSCLTAYLIGHFGEDLAGKCSHCDCCADRRLSQLSFTPAAEISDENWATVHRLLAENHAALQSPTQITRFVCGITSPAITRQRLTKHDAFGIFSDIPFQEVAKAITALQL